jgi:hypothetical protein
MNSIKVKIEGQFIGMYKKNDFTDKETNQTTFGKHVVQVNLQETMKDGSIKNNLLDVSIPVEEIGLYSKCKTGDKIDVPAVVASGQNGLFIYGV